MTSQKYTIQINSSSLVAMASSAICLLVGFLAGGWIFGRPALSVTMVPAQALVPAKNVGAAILSAAAPGDLNAAAYTPRFAQQYNLDYATLVRPMGDQAPLTWVGTPSVTWSGDGYIDIALAARTRAGVVLLELRLVRQGGEGWAVDRLLSLQLREVAR